MHLVHVRGNGAAGLTAAIRLARSGYKVRLSGRPVTKGRIVTLDPSVQDLLQMEFGPDVLSRIPHVIVSHRIICWETDVRETIKAPLIVIDLGDLVSALLLHLPAHVSANGDEADSEEEFVVDATGRQKDVWLRSGVRTALCWLLDINKPKTVAYLIASKTGWMFVSPAPEGRILIQFVVPGILLTDADHTNAVANAQALLKQNNLSCLGNALAQTNFSSFDATPMFRNPHSTKGHVSIGDSAITSDPLAGDGVGRALRSAVAAAAAFTNQSNQSAAMEQYAGRMALAQKHHLQALVKFYESSSCQVRFSSIIRDMNRDMFFLERFASKRLEPVMKQ